eukprot:11912281-Karenia_brevis.AAC.1
MAFILTLMLRHHVVVGGALRLFVSCSSVPILVGLHELFSVDQTPLGVVFSYTRLAVVMLAKVRARQMLFAVAAVSCAVAHVPFPLALSPAQRLG